MNPLTLRNRLTQGAKGAEGSRLLAERRAASDDAARIAAHCTRSEWHAAKRCASVKP